MIVPCIYCFIIAPYKSPPFTTVQTCWNGTDNPTTFSGLIGGWFSTTFGIPNTFLKIGPLRHLAIGFWSSEFSDARIVIRQGLITSHGVHWDLKQRSKKFTAGGHVLVSKGCWEISIHQSKEQNLCWSRKEVYDIYIQDQTQFSLNSTVNTRIFDTHFLCACPIYLFLGKSTLNSSCSFLTGIRGYTPTQGQCRKKWGLANRLFKQRFENSMITAGLRLW